MRYLGLNISNLYFLNPDLGKMLGIQEGDPIEVHQKLIDLVLHGHEPISPQSYVLVPTLQMNSREFYFREAELLTEILEFYKKNPKTMLNSGDIWKVTPSIHEANDTWPVLDNKKFLPTLLPTLQYARQWRSKNITVHLPVRPQNEINSLVDTLTHPDVIKAIRGQPDDFKISIDLENNHHNSFFGNLDNLAEFAVLLDEKLDRLGAQDLKTQINFCFDFGHFATQSTKLRYNKRQMLENFFESQRKRIKTLHLHTNDGSNDQHYLPYNTDSQSIHLKHFNGDQRLLKEHSELLFDCLPILKLHDQDNWMIILETDKPFDLKDLQANNQKIVDCL